MKQYLEFAKNFAVESGEIMKKYFYGENGEEYKFDNTIVTKTDKEINDNLIEKVKKHFPNHCVSGEEKQFGKSEYVWVCDPVDGTSMYAKRIPVAVFSLALVVDGVPKVGVIYDPWTNNLYSAIKGEGAFCNDQKIHVSSIGLEDKKSVAHYDMWPMAEYNVYDAIKELGKKTYFVGLGSVTRACCCVANGDFNVAIFPGTINKNFDIAAAKVIVEEAGGKVTDLFGDEQRYDENINGAIISNGLVHAEVLEVIRKTVENKRKV